MIGLLLHMRFDFWGMVSSLVPQFHVSRYEDGVLVNGEWKVEALEDWILKNWDA